MKINKGSISAVYTFVVIIALASLDNAVVGLFPPLFSSIAKDFDIHVSSLGVVSAVNMFITSLSSIFWAYLADRGKRKPLIITGTIIWSIAVFSTAYSQNYIQLVASQVFTGIGLGCIASIGYSVLTDYIPHKWRGIMLSLWGLSQGFGGIAGAIMASVVATMSNWRKPFEIIAAMGLAFTFLYAFMKEPAKGSAEPALKDLIKEGYEYNYSIQWKHIREILLKKSNVWLMLQGLFTSITLGTLIWLPTLYTSKIETAGYESGTAIIASGFLYALLQTGGLASVYFGYLGDKFQRKTYRGRALLAGITILAALPLYSLMFVIPMRHIHLPHTSNSILILIHLLKEMILNPWMLLMLILAVGATAAQSSNTPNTLAILTDVNFPEHRATAFSILNLISGIGKALGNLLIGIVLGYSSRYLNEPANYEVTLVVFQIFFIPAAFCFYKISHFTGVDSRRVHSTLERRSRLRTNRR